MVSMDSDTILARWRTTAASAGTLLLVSGAFAMYQMTSLMLGSPTSRQFTLSLSAPGVDLQEEASPFGSNRDAVLGQLAAISRPRAVAPAAPAGRATRATPAVSVAHATAPVRAATPAPMATPAPATTSQKPAPTASTDPEAIIETETGAVTGTNYHDPDVRGLRLARGRRPGSRG